VAIITNGTAVLGLGNIGALAGLPVMEGKAALFSPNSLASERRADSAQRHATPERVVATMLRHRVLLRCHPAGGLRRARVFRDRARLRERLAKPVMHDDQHGTAVVALAALQNAATLRLGHSLRH
jgi:malic enzyme